MKRFSALLVASSILLCSLPGCKLLMDNTDNKQPIQAPPLKVTQKVSPIQPDEISPSNAHSKARLLLEELETDGRETKD